MESYLGHDIAEGQATVAEGEILRIAKRGIVDALDRTIRQLLGVFHLLRAKKQQHIGDAEHCRVGPDPNRQRHQRYHCKSRRLPQLPKPIPDVLP